MADDLTAALEEIRLRREQSEMGGLFRPSVAQLDLGHDDVPRLLAAIEAVLKDHRKITVYALSVRDFDMHEPPRVYCGHSYEETENRHHAIADNGDTICLDKPEADVCETCRDEDGELIEWPCSTYLAITRELTGKGGGDGE